MSRDDRNGAPDERQERRIRKREKRRRRVLMYKAMIGAAVLVILGGIGYAIAARPDAESYPGVTLPQVQPETLAEETDDGYMDATPSSAEPMQPETEVSTNHEAEETAVSDSGDDLFLGYENPGIANVSGNLNIRARAEDGAAVIGRLPSNGVCEILEAEEKWYYIQSGGVKGYVSRDYILDGEAARERAEQVLQTQDTLVEASAV